MRALDVGSGHNPVQKSGWQEKGDVDHLSFTNMDFYHPDADIKWDFNVFPWPFDTGTFDIVFLRHTLEHVRRENLLPAMQEIHRVAKDGGYINIRVPFWNSPGWAGDPTHWSPFTEDTFSRFCYRSPMQTDHYIPHEYEFVRVEYRFAPKFVLLPKILLRELMSIWCGVCDELWVTLRVIKSGEPPAYNPRHIYKCNAYGVDWTKVWKQAAFYGGLFWGGLIFLATLVVR